MNKWFRFEDRHYSQLDWSGEHSHTIVRVEKREYSVIKTTPKGVWLDLGFGGKRFVRTDARKQWASPTEEAAKKHFIARKNRQIGILRAQIQHVEEALFQVLTK